MEHSSIAAEAILAVTERPKKSDPHNSKAKLIRKVAQEVVDPVPVAKIEKKDRAAVLENLAAKEMLEELKE